jgi:cyclohexyl-isocyanide hydratase
LRFVPDVVGESLSGYDLLVVPGGSGTRTLMRDADFLRWFGTAADVPLKVSACTGSLLLGAAGFLRGKAATTHPRARPDLAEFCSTVEHRRIVDAGDVVTAAGVTAGIDLGLYLVERLAGAAAREQIARQMDYPYRWSG